MSSSELSESQAVITPRSITYTLTPTYNTSHSRALCNYVTGPKKARRLIESEKQNERQDVYVHGASMHPVLLWRVWWSVSYTYINWIWGCIFLSTFFLPLSMSVLYPTSLFSIFTCSTRCESSKILNYSNGLISVYLYPKQLNSPETHSHCRPISTGETAKCSSASAARLFKQIFSSC